MRSIKLILITVGLFLTLSSAHAADDGFGPAKKIESEHFIISYAPQLDLYSLLEKLNIRPADLVLSEGPSSKGNGLAVALDALYSIVMQAVDMNLYSLQGNLKICRDRDHLNDVYTSIFGRTLKTSSFYINEYNTIYISADDFTKEILGHEIAHMIISHYFVVQPPAKVAEILAGYVEYQLRKSSR
ncbi:MAG TPA: hypothetical protein PL125_06985 [Candidatus Omnitrophota bacterium]|nr:hypothetical protein [Candidatus Omnitrophota bacterium]HPT39921.1 hypothetical protein [Candidatus Omnitrophota bacterium]